MIGAGLETQECVSQIAGRRLGRRPIPLALQQGACAGGERFALNIGTNRKEGPNVRRE
jgi:hypothetical protein